MAGHHPLQGIVTDDEQNLICPIRYLHNPLQSTPPYLHRGSISFPREDPNSCDNEPPYTTFNPFSGTIPYCSSISNVYESRFWPEAMEASRTFIHLLATEKGAFDMPVNNGVTIKDLARRELRPGFKHRTMRSTAYMYPFCVDARRLELISSLMVMLFIFDDKCEGADEKQVPLLVSDFYKRLEDPNFSSNGAKTPLQSYLNAVIIDIHAADAEMGNGGAEVYSETRNALTTLRPRESITSLGDYFKFRRQNISAGWVFACVKFSLASSVDMHQHAIKHFMDLATEHLSIINDLYSYEKEARAFRDQSCPDLFNIVAVVQNLLSLPDECAALDMTYTLLLQREQWLQQELKQLQASQSLDDETWEFLRGVWACLSGNVLFSMTCVRYGGEKARIPKDLKASEKCGCSNSSAARSDSGYSDNL